MGGGRVRAGGAFLALVLLGACGIRHGSGGNAPAGGDAGASLMTARDRARLEALATDRAADPLAGYRIGPDDLLDVRIPDLLPVASPTQPETRGATLPTMSETPVFQQGLRVSAAGDVSLPFLGTVHAAGLSPSELEAEIGRRLAAAGILRQPQVSVTVAEYRSHVVAVVGSVERPGVYPLTRPDARLADLVWAAGGPGKDAGRLVEFKPVGSHEEPIRVDLEALLHAAAEGANAQNPRVRVGDVIHMPPAGNVQVDGWVDKPGSYPVTRGLTLSGAVAAAGGQLFPADRRRATVRRAGDTHPFTVDLDAVDAGRAADPALADGDLVRLPAAPARLLPWGLWILAKEIVHVGGSVALF